MDTTMRLLEPKPEQCPVKMKNNVVINQLEVHSPGIQ